MLATDSKYVSTDIWFSAQFKTAPQASGTNYTSP